MTEQVKNYFEQLSEINVSDKIEKKSGLSYLSWAWAWAELKKRYPSAKKTVVKNEHGWLYHTDGKTCWVEVSVLINDVEETEYLPVMDYKNQSIPLERITSTAVNTALQRAITKAIARHGLGLYIYAGEDLPEGDPEPKNKTGITQNLADGVDEDMKEVFNNKNQADYEKIKKAIVGCGSVEELEAEKLKFKKEANSLKKYRPELYAEIAEISLKEEAKILGIDIAELTALKKKKKEQMGE